jgi:hypothetical protein
VEHEVRVWTAEVIEDEAGRQPPTIQADRSVETKFVTLDSTGARSPGTVHWLA